MWAVGGTIALNYTCSFTPQYGYSTSGLPQTSYQQYETGYSTNRQSRRTDLGIPNVRDIGIGFINGIFTSYMEALENAKYISMLLGGYNVDLVYNGSRGPDDIFESLKNLNYTSTEPCALLHETWDAFFARSENGYYLQYCHSQGTALVRNALLDYPPELRNRIILVPIAPSGYIFEQSCFRVTHYRAAWYRDFIPQIDRLGAERERHTIVDLPSHPEAKFFDHSFQSPTYKKKIRDHGLEYLENGR